MVYGILKLSVYLICFLAALYALSGVQFDRFVNVRQPMKAQVLFLLLAMALAYLCGTLILELTIFNGLRSSSSMRACTGSWLSKICCRGKN